MVLRSGGSKGSEWIPEDLVVAWLSYMLCTVSWFVRKINSYLALRLILVSVTTELKTDTLGHHRCLILTKWMNIPMLIATYMQITQINVSSFNLSTKPVYPTTYFVSLLGCLKKQLRFDHSKSKLVAFDLFLPLTFFSNSTWLCKPTTLRNLKYFHFDLFPNVHFSSTLLPKSIPTTHLDYPNC